MNQEQRKKLQDVKLVNVYISDQKADGTKFIDRNGKPFQRIAIKTNVHGDNYLSSFIFQPNDPKLQFKVNDQVKILVWQSNGYWNFDLPDKNERLNMRIDELEKRVAALEVNKTTALNNQSTQIVNKMNPPLDDIKPGDLPF